MKSKIKVKKERAKQTLMEKLKEKGIFLLSVVLSFGVLSLSACGEDDESVVQKKKHGETMTDPKAGFTLKIDENDHFTVRFSNTSQNAVRYSWDFGDESTSTNKDPNKKYSEEGPYKIRLTAYGSEDEDEPNDTFEAKVFISQFLRLLTGSPDGTTAGSKKWILRRTAEPTLGVGSETTKPHEFWSFGYEGTIPTYERPCIVDDEYTFEILDARGTPSPRFVVDTKDTFFLDTGANGGHKKGDVEACQAEASVTDAIWTLNLDAVTGETFPNSNEDSTSDVYDYHNKSGDADKGGYGFTLEANQLTINGGGSYIGLQSKSNAGNKGYLVPQMRTFTISELARFDRGSGVTGTEMTLQMLVENDDDADVDAVWTFHLEHYDKDSNIPDVPSAPTYPVDFEAFCPGINGFGDTSGTGGTVGFCVDNPAQDGINTSRKALELVEGAGGQILAGAFFTMPDAVDFSSNCGVKMKVRGRSGLKVLSRLEEAVSDRYAVELEQAITTADTWETLSFDYSTLIPVGRSNVYSKFVLFLDNGTAAEETLYIDDFEVDTTVGACARTGAASATLAIDFQGADCPVSFTGFDGFGGVTCPDNNPGGGGSNTTTKVANLTSTGSNANEGVYFRVPDVGGNKVDIDFGSNCGLKMDVYGPGSGAVTLKLEKKGTQDGAVEVAQSITTTDTWEKLSFDYSALIPVGRTKDYYNTVVLWLGKGVAEGTATNLYIDNLEPDSTIGACAKPTAR